MGLLYPFALLTALAAAIPILLHFWRRETAEPPDLFPGVFFLVDPAAPRPQKARPLTWLLTLLRTALILVLALLAAGPYRPTQQTLALPEHPVLLGVVIDDSPSMRLPVIAAPDAPTRLQAALTEANRLIDQLPAGSGLVWTTTSGRFHALQILPDALPAASRTAAHIDCPVSDAAGDLGRALDRVANAAQQLAFPLRQVVILSDRTVGVEGVRTREYVQAALAKLAAADIAVTLLPPQAPDSSPRPIDVATPAAMQPPPFTAPRLKILSLDRPSSWRVGRPLTLTVQVLFDNAQPAAATAAEDSEEKAALATRRVDRLTWQIGAETIEQANPIPVQSIDLPCHLRLQTFELARPFMQSGWWKLAVTAFIDEQRQDTWTTFLAVRQPTPVWLVEPDEPAGDSRFLALAIDPTRSGAGGLAGGDWALLRKTYTDLRGDLPVDGVLVLWGAGRGLAADDWDRIAAAAARGMGLWCVPDGGPLPTQRVHPAVFWTADEAAPLPRQLGRPAPLALLPIRGQPNNSIRTALQAVGGDIFTPATVDRFYPVRAAGNGVDTVLAVAAGQDQLNGALLEMPLGRGTGLLLAVPPVAGNGGWVQSALWPLLTDLALERLAPVAGEWPDGEVGRPLPGQAGPEFEPPFGVKTVTLDRLPAGWNPGSDDDPFAPSGPYEAIEFRPLRHFFRDGRFHFMGETANRRSLLLVYDHQRRLAGVEVVQTAAREWDDTLLIDRFWSLDGNALGTAPDSAAILRALRQRESAAANVAELPVAVRGDLTPWVLAVLVVVGLGWVWLERREYQSA